MKQKFTLIAFACASALILFTSASQMSESPNGKVGKNGSPGEQTCLNGCHSSYTLNSGSGSVAINVVGVTNGEYVPGQSYTVEVTVAYAGRSLFGFGCEALLSSGANAGTLTAGSDSHTGNATVSGNSRRTVTQNQNSGAIANTKTWSFTWAAPAAGGDVTFYAAGLAANGNGNESSDYVYTTNLTLSSAVGVLEVDQADLALQVFPNPTQDLVQLNYTLQNSGTVEVQLFDVRGSLIRSMGKSNQGVGAVNQTFSIADLAAGTYCIQLRLDGQLMASRLVNKQ